MMRKQDISRIAAARQAALLKYEEMLKNLKESNQPELFAQAANDAYLEYKKLDTDFKNSAVLKKMTDLFHY